MLSEFISTVYGLVKTGHYAELVEYFRLIREIISQPSVVITPGIPRDKQEIPHG